MIGVSKGQSQLSSDWQWISLIAAGTLNWEILSLMNICIGRGEKHVQGFGGKARRRDHLEDGIRMDLTEIGLGGMDWIQLAQDRDRWRAVVSAVMNVQVLASRS
jgi:hypothetical protein